MTIAELIEILKTYDQEAFVYRYSPLSFHELVRGVARIYESGSNLEMKDRVYIY